LMLPTGGRSMNAMMVGPWPFGRILCVTDGLLGALDDELLSGVVAHEVGHARMGHPALLLLLTGVVPLLLMSPALAFDQQVASASWQALSVVILGVFTWSVVRTLAHRFEHEADVASVKALGAGPCSRALLAVAGAAVPHRQGGLARFTSLHPEERIRCTTMLRYELDAEFRRRFDATGTRVRLAIFGCVGLAALVASTTWWIEWRYEHVIWRLNSGDIVASRQLDAAIGNDVPERWRRTWTLVREDLAAAADLARDAMDWPVARQRFDELAWSRGVEVLLAKGPAAARPWFALAAEVDGPDRIVRHLLHEFCHAAQEGVTSRMDAVRDVLRARGVPPQLEPVFRD